MKIVLILLVIVAFVFLSKRRNKIMGQPSQTPKLNFKPLGNKGNNTYYLFPSNEYDFAKEAFEDKGIVVKIIHSDGHTEILNRKVHKIWESKVLWNIETMHSTYTESKLNAVSGLTVYACPQKYIKSIP